MADVGIRLVGWREFVRDLRRTAPELAKELRRANAEIARDVRDDSRDAARSESRQYAKAATGIQSRAFPDSAQIVLNPRRYPWIFGAEFGALAYRQFPIWRGNQWTSDSVGYAVFPTIRESEDEIADEYGDRVMDAMRVAFPERGVI